MSRNPLMPRPAITRRLRLAVLWTCACTALVGAAAIPASTSAPTTVTEAAAPAPAVVPSPVSEAPAIAPGEPNPQNPVPAPPAPPEPPTPPAPPEPPEPPEPPAPPAPEPEPTREAEPASRSTVRTLAGSPKAYAAELVDSTQFNCLNPLWERESGWNPYAVNRSSGAYGIPQALGHGHPYDLGDYRAQIDWGLNYISTTYGSPCRAWSFWQAHHWY